MLGNAIEDAIVKNWLSDLHWYGAHLLGTQVPVGGSDPNWDGYLDALISEEQEDGTFKTKVVEIKTAYGYGADLFSKSFEIKEDYMGQLGDYLKDMHNKGVTNEGMFLYLLMSDRSFGTLITIDCYYDPETNHIYATEAKSSDGTKKTLSQSLDLGITEARRKKLEMHLQEKTVPEPEYQYKYPLTTELIDSLSDAKLRDMIRGNRVEGDWRVKYSDYKDKQLEVDGVSPGYTKDEIEILRAAYKRRHPKSKL